MFAPRTNHHCLACCNAQAMAATGSRAADRHLCWRVRLPPIASGFAAPQDRLGVRFPDAEQSMELCIAAESRSPSWCAARTFSLPDITKLGVACSWRTATEISLTAGKRPGTAQSGRHVARGEHMNQPTTSASPGTRSPRTTSDTKPLR
jgi:hypothetical protein